MKRSRRWTVTVTSKSHEAVWRVQYANRALFAAPVGALRDVLHTLKALLSSESIWLTVSYDYVCHCTANVSICCCHT